MTCVAGGIDMSVNTIANISIDTGKLLEAELIKVKMRELMRQTAGVMRQMRKDMEYSPFLYA
jgi:predicted ATP-grasp superfamily ATP-dependent carboligase